MKQLKTFLLAIALTFGFPWLVLIVLPSIKMAGSIVPVPYGEDDETTGFFPRGQAYLGGQAVYEAEGCAQCHTQMIRPVHAGLDGWRQGWGMDQEDRPEAATRPSVAHDYLGEPYAHLGIQRNLADLSNVGYRRPDASWHYAHLFDPRGGVGDIRWSTMPSFRHLFDKREITGDPSDDAVATDGDYEYVPSPDARALVQYLLSLKKDSPLPTVVAARPGADSDAGAE